MGAIMMTFLMLWAGSGYLGIRILGFTLRRWQLDPEIPTARVANTGGAELAYQHATDAAASGSRSLAKAAGLAVGLLLVLWPFAVVIWYFTTSWRLGIGSI